MSKTNAVVNKKVKLGQKWIWKGMDELWVRFTPLCDYTEVVGKKTGQVEHEGKKYPFFGLAPNNDLKTEYPYFMSQDFFDKYGILIEDIKD